MGLETVIQSEQRNHNTDRHNSYDGRSQDHLENVHSEVTVARLSGNQTAPQNQRDAQAEIKDKDGKTTHLSLDGDIYNQTSNGQGTNQKREAGRDGQTDKGLAEGQSKAETGKTPALSVTEFAQKAKELLPKLDKNHDGKITERELGQAMADKSFTGQEAQVLAALYHNFKSLSEKHGGQDSITAQDIDRQFSGKVSAKEAEYAKQETKLDELIENHPEFLGGDEKPSVDKIKTAINTALSSDKYSDDEKQTLKYYQEKLKDVKDAANNINGGETGNNKDPIENKIKMMKSIQKDLNAVAKNENSNCHQLYKGNDAITPDAVKQAGLGDCYLEASIAAAAKNHPEQIKNMIADNHDGTYTVTFPGDTKHPVTVTAPTAAEGGLYNQGSEHGIWPGVLEKAYGQYQKTNKKLGDEYTPAQATDSGDYDGHGGGSSRDALHLLTGNSIKRFDLKNTSQHTMAQKLEDAMKNHKCVTIASPEKTKSTDPEASGDGVFKDHEYTVIGFTPDGKGGGTVIIRNPWGNGTGKEGTFTMPLEKVMNPEKFEEVNIENSK